MNEDEIKYNSIVQDLPQFPKGINLELTNYCNLKCNFCLNPSNNFREKGLMSDQIFNKIVDEVPQETIITLCGIGEPTLHPNFLNYIKKLNSDSKINTVFLVTNAHQLKDEVISCVVDSIVSKITFSLDYFDQKEYRRHKQGELNKAISSIDRMISERRRAGNKKLQFQINMHAQKFNEKQIEGAIKYFSDRLNPGDVLI